MREWHVENQIGKENHFEYRSIQKIGSAKSYILNTEEYRQESTVLHIEDVTLFSVPKYRSIQTKVNNVAHTTTQNSFRAQEGGGAGGGPSGSMPFS